ncbi:sensor histidine kinase [Kurthia gibsonii]|uniref:sensor histidine kinase n=1 Tax=Kurthia gibsonii TaxID=33946 RepID=UPI002DB9B0D2|nr:sensor histidine kinase [Kurthia gibsonii]MEB7772179.1 sensor histidine kinase [Kurthia gibsonii]
MTKVILRTLFLATISFALLAMILYMLWGENSTQWEMLYEKNYANLPYGVWMLIFFGGFSLLIAMWSNSLTIQKENQLTKQLNLILEGQFQTAKKRPVSKKNFKKLQAIDDLVQTQKKSLQRLTNDHANIQEKEVQERLIQERQRLARELHDSVSQQLFAASMLLSATNETIGETLPEANQKQLQQTEKIVQQAQLEMRALLLHLRPIALKNKSLAQGLQDLLDELRQKVYFNIQERLEEVSLPKGAEDHVFRIAQETLSNTLRHAKATEVQLLLVERNGLVIFRLQDNGVGFSIQDDDHAGSYGLRNVEERAVEIGGTCKVVSIPEQGTIIEVQIPVEQEETK